MIRLIPNLIIEDRNAVKRNKFLPYKYLGDPFNIVKILNDKCIDELIITNISGLNEQEVSYIKKLNGICFMPLCYGGGITTFDQAINVMSVGIERIHINTLIYQNFNEFEKIVNHLGGSSVVAVVNIKRKNGHYNYSSSCGTYVVDADIIKIIQRLIKTNVSEIMFNIVDDENSKSGYDKNFIEFINSLPKYNYLLNGGLNKSNVRGISDQKMLSNYKSINGFVGSNYFFCRGKFDGVLISYEK